MNLFKSYFVNSYFQKALMSEEQRKEVAAHKESLYIHMDKITVSPQPDLDKTYNLEKNKM
jgi:hypothetical protein